MSNDLVTRLRRPLPLTVGEMMDDRLAAADYIAGVEERSQQLGRHIANLNARIDQLTRIPGAEPVMPDWIGISELPTTPGITMPPEAADWLEKQCERIADLYTHAMILARLPRDPTDAMIKAAGYAIDAESVMEAIMMWQAMYDEALKPKGEDNAV